MNWLHSLEVLESLAEAPPGPIRDWANTRLAIRAPSRVKHLPTEIYEDTEIALVAGAPVRDPLDVRVEAVDALGWAGRIPEDPREWVDRLRPVALAQPDAARIRLLADLGALDADLLGAVSRLEDPAAHAVTPGLVLRWAAAHERPLDDLAARVAEGVDRLAPELTELAEINSVLGIPRLQIFATDEREALELGSTRAGRPVRAPPQVRGSARRRAIRTVQSVLDGVPGPAAAWLRALVTLECAPPDWVCGLAGWVAAREPVDDPVTDVCGRAGGEDRRTLAAARRAVRPAHRALVEQGLDEPEIGIAPAQILALDLLLDESCADLAPRMWEDGIDGERFAVVTVAVARSPVPFEWNNALGLMFARFVPREDVLASLLLMDEGRGNLLGMRGWALAEMADPAAHEALEGVAAAHPDDEDLAEALAFSASLLGR
jgi:hypothetical protein